MDENNKIYFMETFYIDLINEWMNSVIYLSKYEHCTKLCTLTNKYWPNKLLPNNFPKQKNALYFAEHNDTFTCVMLAFIT